MKIVDISNYIHICLGSPTSTTVPAISYWIRGKVGWLNTMLYEDFYLSDSLEILNADGTEISTMVAEILMALYQVYDMEMQARLTTNALAVNGLLSVKDELAGTSITWINKNELAKTFISIRKDNILLLNRLVDSYRSLKSSPSQVAGDDTLAGFINGAYTYRPFLSRVGPYAS